MFFEQYWGGPTTYSDSADIHGCAYVAVRSPSMKLPVISGSLICAARLTTVTSHLTSTMRCGGIS